MPTRPDFDVVPIRKATKRKLTQLKGARTYDDAIASLLARADTPLEPPRARERPPEKERALADLAARRWRMRVERGEIVELGPRLFIYRLRSAEPRRQLHVTWPDGRGFAP